MVVPAVTAVNVGSDGDGALVVSWATDPGVEVDVCVGPSPEAIDHDRPVHQGRGPGSARLSGFGAGRPYVSVAPRGGGSAVVAAERRVPVEGALNLRDLGGYPTDDGRHTRWGRVFRSDALHALTDGDLAVLTTLGLRTVYDLRRAVERERQPSRLPAGDVRSVLLAIGGEASEQPEIIDLILAGELDEAGVDFMVEIYGRILTEAAPAFGALLTGLAEPAALPALFHCTAGKDRTGVAAALLLAVLGVDEETILDDYELSTEYRSNRRIEQLRPQLEGAGVDVEAVRPFLSAPRPVLAAALVDIHRDHGTVERYLVEAAGMAPATLHRLRELLVT